MTAHDSMAVLVALATQLQREPDESQINQGIVVGLGHLVPEADHISLTLGAPRRAYATVASSDPVAEEIDALQHAVGEGPCHLALGRGAWIRSGEVDDDARWPSWGPRAADLGVRSLLAVAVTDREESIGVLHLYSGAPGGFADRAAIDLVLAYSVLAATALSIVRRDTTMRAAVSSRHVIGMAQGIAMERYDLEQPHSFELLRRLSSTSNVKLRDVAAQIVETRTIGDVARCERPLD